MDVVIAGNDKIDARFSYGTEPSTNNPRIRGHQCHGASQPKPDTAKNESVEAARMNSTSTRQSDRSAGPGRPSRPLPLCADLGEPLPAPRRARATEFMQDLVYGSLVQHQANWMAQPSLEGETTSNPDFTATASTWHNAIEPGVEHSHPTHRPVSPDHPTMRTQTQLPRSGRRAMTPPLLAMIPCRQALPRARSAVVRCIPGHQLVGSAAPPPRRSPAPARVLKACAAPHLPSASRTGDYARSAQPRAVCTRLRQIRAACSAPWR